MSSRYTHLQTEAAEWLIRLDAGTVDESAFAAWRDADPLHAVAFAEAQSAWETMEAGPPASAFVPPPEPRIVSRRQLIRAAAAALPVLAVGSAAFMFLKGERAYAETKVGQRRSFAAMAGVQIDLNTDSQISWKAADTSCEIWLERGEAGILLDGSRLTGAVLHCGSREMTLAPGRYNARTTGEGAALHVLDGDAWVRDEPSTRARVGDRLELTADTSRVEALAPDALQIAAAWQKGEIILDGQPLGEALIEFNRYLDKKLIVRDAELGALRIGGRFGTDRPDAFLAAMETAFDLETVDQGNHVLIKRKITPR